MSNDQPAKGVDTHAWEEFCEALKSEGARILQSEQRLDEVTRAEGLRYLSRLVRAGFERYIEFANPVNPAFFKLCHETIKVGGDNPDNLYLSCRVSSDHTYRITGNRGTVHYISISLADDQLETTGRQLTTAFLDSRELRTDANGDFVIQVGGDPVDGNWVPLKAGTNTIFIRQTFQNRTLEREATFRIVRTSPLSGDDNITVAEIERGLERARAFFGTTGRLFVDWAESYSTRCNTLPPADQGYIASVGGDPNIYYYLSAFALQPGEALLIHLPEVPECEMWNLQLCNHWMESLDYVNHRIHCNRETARRNNDGSVTVVIADQNPGVANWLDTCGHRMGTMVFRWTRAKKVVHPRSAKVRIDEVNMADYQRRWSD